MDADATDGCVITALNHQKELQNRLLGNIRPAGKEGEIIYCLQMESLNHIKT